MSNTPETDEIEKHDGITIRDSVTTCGDESSSVYINVIHAREFERERNELIEENKKLNKEVDDLIRKRPLLIEDFKHERDEAVEEIKEWETLCLWGGTPEHIHGFIRGQQTRIWHLECERDEAKEKIKRQTDRIRYLEGATNHACGTPLSVALRERDEALSQIVQAECRAERYCQERDEARSLLKSAQSALDAIHLEVGAWIKIMKENTD